MLGVGVGGGVGDDTGVAVVGVARSTSKEAVSQAPEVAIAGFALVCIGQSICFPNISALISQAAPPDRQGEVLGWRDPATGSPLPPGALSEPSEWRS